jgi:hypothetical protein
MGGRATFASVPNSQPIGSQRRGARIFLCLTWQVAGGLGYRWGKRWSTQLGYRRLYFNRTNNGLTIEQTQQGLLLGVTLRCK